MISLFVLAQASSPLGKDGPNSKGPDIVVEGKRIKGAAIGDESPVISFRRREIQAMGADTAEDVLKSIRDASPGGSKMPLILLNGKRVAGMASVQFLPAEAILRVDMFAGQESIRYGVQDGSPVINVVTVSRYRAAKVTQGAGASTDGGGADTQSNVNYTRIVGDRLLNLSAKYDRTGEILQRIRNGGVPLSGSLYNTTGNVTSRNGGSLDPALDLLAGRAVTVAGIPNRTPILADFLSFAQGRADDLSRSDRSLRPDTSKLSLNAVLTGQLFGNIASSLTLGLERSRQLSSLGYAPITLTVPAGSRFSPFANDIRLYRYADETTDLEQISDATNLQLGATFSGGLGGWNWSADGGYTHNQIVAQVDHGIATVSLQSAIDQGTINPFARFSADLLRDRQVSVSRFTERGANLLATAYGTPFRLPAGNVLTVITASAASSRLRSSLGDSNEGGVSISQDTIGSTLSVDLPIASAAENILPFLNSATINVNAGFSQVSRFGLIPSYGAALSWTPIPRAFLNVSLAEQGTPPTAIQLSAPVLFTPNATAFDYSRGITTVATIISGGNPNLAAERKRSLSLLLGATTIAGIQVSMKYTAQRTRHPVRTLPTVTPAIEAAFSERFIRADDGALIRIDSRPVNFEREDEERLETSIFVSRPIGKAPPMSAGAAIGAQSASGEDESGQMTIRLSHQWRLRDKLLIRHGLPVLDLLGGDVVDGLTGQVRHEVTFEMNRNVGALGTTFGVRWQNGTYATTADGERLRFSGLLKVNARAFLNIERISVFKASPWARGLRMSLSADNLLNRRIQLTNERGNIVSGYNASYVDPVGRSIGISFRKLF